MKNISPFTAERHGLFLAVLIHLLVAEIFIFSFPVKDVAHKPSFVFLGSFLDPIDDTLSVDKYSLNLHDLADFPDTDAASPPVRVKKRPVAIQNLKKKKIIKTTFLDNHSPAGKTAASDSFLDSTKVRIQSLKIAPGGIW